MFMRKEIVNPCGTNYIIITAFVDGIYRTSAYALTDDGEFQGFITNEKVTNRDHVAQRNHDYFCKLYDDSQKEKPHECDYCGKPFADRCEYLSKKTGKPVYLCTTCYQVNVAERV